MLPRVSTCESAVVIMLAFLTSFVTGYQYERPWSWPQRGPWHAPLVAKEPRRASTTVARQGFGSGLTRRQLVGIVTSIASDPTLLVTAGLVIILHLYWSFLYSLSLISVF